MSFLPWHLCPHVSNTGHVPTLGRLYCPPLVGVSGLLYLVPMGQRDPFRSRRPWGPAKGLGCTSVPLPGHCVWRASTGRPLPWAWGFMQVQALALPLPGWAIVSCPS